MNLIEKVFGTHSERELKLIRPIVDKILGMREQMVALSDDELRDNTRKFKERLANGETLDDLLPEAFATVRETGIKYGALPGSADRWYRPASGTYRRDAYW